MITIQNLSLRIAGRELIQDSSAQLPSRGCVGLVGRNGAGKSTLLGAIVDPSQIDQGEIIKPQGSRLGVSKQEAPSGSLSLIETVLTSHEERQSLLAILEGEGADAQDIATAQERYEAIDGYSAPARAARILAGLGFSEDAQQQACDDFSGGWRMRVALASILFQAPDILLLDEPTNHLDLEATLWLESYLKRYEGLIVLVSHDRDLLNRMCDWIWHLNNKRLKLYRGNFDRFQATRAEQRALEQKQAVKQEAAAKHMQAFVDRFRYKASKARQAQSRIKMLERMQPIVLEEDNYRPYIAFPEIDELPPPLVKLENAAVGYDGKPVLSRIQLNLDADSRIALLGANGNGKSTLIKLLSGELPAIDGDIYRASKLRFGYFAQHQAEALPLDSTPLQVVLASNKQLNDEKARALLGRFGFGAVHADTKISELSGGEKARLLLALVARTNPHVLLLDEPTNHLDIETREALVEAINRFQGAVVLVSHDPSLIALTAEQLWLVKDGSVTIYDGDLDDYRRQIVSPSDRKAGSDKRAAAKQSEIVSSKAVSQIPAAKVDDKKPSTSKLKKDVQKLEEELQRLTFQKERVDGRLGEADLYEPANAKELAKIQAFAEELSTKISDTESRWLDAEAALDASGAP